MQYLADFKAKHAGPPEGKRPKLDKESSGGSLSAKSTEMVEINPGHRRIGSVGSMGSVTYASSFPSPGGLPLAFTTAGNQVLARKPAGTSPHAESPSSQLPMGPKLRSAISVQSSTSEESWPSRGDQADSMQRTALSSLVTAPTVYQALSSLPPLDTSSSDENVRQASRRTYHPGHRDALPPMHPDPATYQQYRSPMASVVPTTAADERWRTIQADVASRQMPDLPRGFTPSLTMGQNVPFGTAQLPPLVGSEWPSETQHDHLQRTLPPPRLSSPRDRPRALPSLSRARSIPGQSSDGTPATGGGGSDAPHLDRSESEAINALAGLASTGARGAGSEGQASKLVKR